MKYYGTIYIIGRFTFDYYLPRVISALRVVTYYRTIYIIGRSHLKIIRITSRTLLEYDLIQAVCTVDSGEVSWHHLNLRYVLLECDLYL